jgi:hypothetical protein
MPYSINAPYSFTLFSLGANGTYETPNTVYLTDDAAGTAGLHPIKGDRPAPLSNITKIESKDYKDYSSTKYANPSGYTYGNRIDLIGNIGNVSPGAIFANVTRNAAIGAASFLGNPITQQFAQPAISTAFKTTKLDGIDDGRSENMGQPYSMVPFTRLSQIAKWPSKYQDFRSFKGYTFSIDNMRLDGASAAARGVANLDAKGSIIAAAYAVASAAPGGAYQVFNIESIYGWGNHGEPNALHRDFTARSHVATRWKPGTYIDENYKPKKGKWLPTNNPAELVTEFRGDKITVIDYSQRKLSHAYRWKPAFFPGAQKFNNFISTTDLTKDFIKFYFTGPKLQNGADEIDDIIVFRAIIDSFTDTHSPSWSAVNMIGRADPNYMYTGYSREVSISFTVFATSRDEMKPIYRKLNALASYTAPEYGVGTIAMKSPWMRMTIGDLLVQQPVLINSLSYTLVDGDTTWEINIEDDPTMMQAPHKISVTLGLNVITDYLPEKNGKMYTLAKKFNADAMPLEGGNNWLSDFGSTAMNDELLRQIADKQQDNLKVKDAKKTKGIKSPSAKAIEAANEFGLALPK